ncbi:MAG: glutaminyl-peptide cyclotransferase [Chloroflexi bacterium]|nr:glutaminyl-peptide cyclotransferase [Chloroflexota bacterium]
MAGLFPYSCSAPQETATSKTPLATGTPTPVSTATSTPIQTLAPAPTSTPPPTSPATPPPAPLPTPTPSPTPETFRAYKYRVVNTFPHDPNAFTQGLVFEDGFLYEGTGLVGKSSLRKVELSTGKVLKIREIPAPYFAEGITIYRDKIIQLTLNHKKGFVYDKDSFESLREFSHSTAGWGLTHDGKRLILSDGTATLYFLNIDTFEVIGRIEVRDENGPVTKLNELEYVNGKIYANVWQTDHVVIISPETGKVTGRIDLKGLLTPEEANKADVLNGIAYDAKGNRLFVTGKYYPKVFEIEVVPE